MDACGCLWMPVGTFGRLWVPLDACGCLWMPVCASPPGHTIVTVDMQVQSGVLRHRETYHSVPAAALDRKFMETGGGDCDDNDDGDDGGGGGGEDDYIDEGKRLWRS